MFKRRIVRQENIKDCGAACLLMMMRKYGGNYPLEQLREMLNIDSNGTSAYNLIKAAQKVGFDARGYKCEGYEQIICPVIAHIIINKTYHHYVIIDNIDFKRKTIKILDPAFGIKQYSFDDFNQIWSHIIITLRPNRKIDNIDTFKDIKKTFVHIIKPHTKYFILIFIFSILYTILNIINTFYFKLIIDDNLESNLYLYLFIFFITVIIAKAVIDYLRNKILISVDKKVDEDLMNDTFKHLLELPFPYFHSRTTGDIVARINDLSYVRDLISHMSVILLVDLVLVVGSIIFMILINFTLFLIGILIILLYFVIVFIYNRSIKYYINKNQELNAIVSSSFVENIKGIETIKNLGIEDKIHINVMNKYDDLIKNNYEFSKKYNLVKMFKDFIIDGGIVIILYLGSILIKNNIITLGDLILFSFFLNFFLEPMKNIFEAEPLLRSCANALFRMSEFYNIKPDRVHDSDVILKGNIEFKNTFFSYNDIDNAVQGINFDVLEGEKVMIAGTSGSGKSTMMKLLMRYYDVSNNQIFIDGKDLLDYSIKDIRSNICYVSQQEMLFTDSLYNNIVLNREIEVSKVKEVFNTTFINEIINRHNTDYYMLIEENGINLSGGERQRIMIARGLLKNSSIIVLDESMSEMDINLEKNILKNIFSKYSKKTIIVISHRLDNAKLFDRVITLNKLKKGDCS